MSLKREAAWTGLDTLVAAGINFLLRMAIARMLAPDDFGIAALLLTVMALLQAFNDFGFTATLIQRADGAMTPRLVGTTFVLSALVSLALFATMLTFGSTLAQSVFDQPDLAGYLRIFSILLLFSPISTISTALLYRKRKFREISIVRIVSVLAGLLAAIIVLAIDPSPWAVVVQSLVTGFISTTMLAIYARFDFPIRFDRAELGSIMGFSGFILLSDLTGALQAQAGVIILGATLGAKLAGFYALAFYLTDTARKMLMSVLNRVTFVHYSRNQHDRIEIRRAFLATIIWNCRIIFPIMLTAIIFAPAFTLLALGQEWAAINTPIRWLALSVIIGTAGGTTSALFKSLGRPGLDFLIMLVTTVALLLPAIYFGSIAHGLAGAAIATFAVKVIAVVIRLVITARMLPDLLQPLCKQICLAILNLWPIAAVYVPARWLGDMSIGPHMSALLQSSAALMGLALYALLEWPRAFPQAKLPWRRQPKP